jgi:hypothetical protein
MPIFYEIKDRGTWKQVVYSDETKKTILRYLRSYPGARSTEIRDALFPDMLESVKANAAHEIQVVLGRDYAGN